MMKCSRGRQSTWHPPPACSCSCSMQRNRRTPHSCGSRRRRCRKRPNKMRGRRCFPCTSNRILFGRRHCSHRRGWYCRRRMPLNHRLPLYHHHTTRSPLRGKNYRKKNCQRALSSRRRKPGRCRKTVEEWVLHRVRGRYHGLIFDPQHSPVRRRCSP
jgi:hypothetical protein